MHPLSPPPRWADSLEGDPIWCSQPAGRGLGQQVVTLCKEKGMPFSQLGQPHTRLEHLFVAWCCVQVPLIHGQAVLFPYRAPIPHGMSRHNCPFASALESSLLCLEYWPHPTQGLERARGSQAYLPEFISCPSTCSSLVIGDRHLFPQECRLPARPDILSCGDCQNSLIRAQWSEELQGHQ